MTETQINLPPPPALHPDTVAEAAALYAKHPTLGILAVVYCRRNRVGGRYFPGARLWQLVGPIGLHEFLEQLRVGGHEIPEAETMWSWLESVADRSGTEH
jgi:hypothetical protein